MAEQQAWPPNYKMELQARFRRLRIIRSSPQVLAAALVYYKTRPVEFIRHWGMTYDPRRESMRVLPFVLFQRQVDWIHWMEARYHGRMVAGIRRREDGITEKCRDMGVTWLCGWWSLHKWLFHEGTKIGFGSRKEDLVDKLGDPDSIFEKLRIGLRRVPAEFMPRQFKWHEHDNFLKLVNPDNGSAITGEAGDNIGRGGRNGVYFLDEAAHVERPERVDAALDDNSDCKVYVSTPKGSGNTFYRKRFSGLYPVFTFRWNEHPGKTREWYDAEKKKRDPVNFAQEIEIDYEASLENITIPAHWVRAARELENLKPKGLRIAGGDVGGGSDRSVFIIRQGSVMERPKVWNDPDVINTAAMMVDLMKSERAACLNYDVFGIGTGMASALKRLETVNAQGINVGQPPTDRLWKDGKTGKEKFLNLKAELWWMMRDRFHATYEHVLYLLGEGGTKHPPEDLISVPADAEDLCRQLSTPMFFELPNGKIQIETKDQLKKRGVKSPDEADAMALTFAPVRGEVRAVTVKGMY